MNQYDPIIKEFLLLHKNVSLEKIGVLSFTQDSTLTDDTIQTGFLQFKYDKNTFTSPDLIELISEKTGKNKILVNSDLSSILEQARQFINIGKPYEIYGIGTFSVNNARQYDFLQASANTAKQETISQKKKDKENYSRKQGIKTNNKNAVIIVALFIVIVIAGGLGWGAYKLFFEKKLSQNITDSTLNQQKPSPPDTTVSKMPAEVVADSTTDSSYYKFIFETTSSPQRAYSRVAALRKMGDDAALDSLPGDSSITYHLFIPKKILAADTAIFKDSLHKYFNRDIKIQSVHN